ncbi:glycosyltransferase [uncultured Eubacterium sp.]|uniref:glycosyltransferase family 2 protein n=1 Tax=uncultured Eubacterium sp. TaxID=165185 RepID=UPI0026723769|nr:glycosyltransferase [uncultured Eubacterium sp.]
MDKVSIVIPVYNADKYINQCIQSVVCQKYENIEIIIIDDYSTDNSLNRCKQYEKEDNRIKVYQANGKGVSAARNTGISKATGKYICFLDSDDAYETAYVETMLYEINKDKSELVVCGYKEIYSKEENNKRVSNQSLSVEEYLNIMVSNRETEDMVNYPWNKLYVRQILDDNNIRFDETISVSEDALFNMIYLQHINKVTVIEECLYKHYMVEGSLVNSKIELDKQKDTLLMIFKEYERNYSIRNMEDKYRTVIGKKLLYYFLRLCQIYKGDKLRQIIKELHHTDYFKYIKKAECINLNYKIFKWLYCFNLNRLLAIYSEVKQ